VREAVNQLISEGLIEQVPHFGMFVRSLERDELAQLFDYREMLECQSIAEAAQRRSAEQLAELERCFNEMSIAADAARAARDGEALVGELRARTVALDLEFHTRLARMAGNVWLERALTSSGVLTRVFAASSVTKIRSPREVVIENPLRHVDLLDAVKRGEPELARARMGAEMRRTRDEVLAHYQPAKAEASPRKVRLRDSASGLRRMTRGAAPVMG
jgi:DNA-binding GntR family transcriptional regulator